MKKINRNGIYELKDQTQKIIIIPDLEAIPERAEKMEKGEIIKEIVQWNFAE